MIEFEKNFYLIVSQGNLDLILKVIFDSTLMVSLDLILWESRDLRECQDGILKESRDLRLMGRLDLISRARGDLTLRASLDLIERVSRDWILMRNYDLIAVIRNHLCNCICWEMGNVIFVSFHWRLVICSWIWWILVRSGHSLVILQKLLFLVIWILGQIVVRLMSEHCKKPRWRVSFCPSVLNDVVIVIQLCQVRHFYDHPHNPRMMNCQNWSPTCLACEQFS